MGVRKLDVYGKKIEEAKKIVSLLKLSNKHRMQVAKIATEVCVILHGGRAPTGRYGLAKFAKEIGINHRTVYEWVRVYRYVYNKLTDTQKEDFHAFPSNLLRPVMNGVSENAKPSVVQRRFTSVVSQGRTANKMQKYVQNMNSILYNVSNHSRMVDAPDKLLIELYEKASLIRGYLDKEFDARKLKTKPTVKQPKIDMSKFWHDEIGVQ